MKQAWSFLVIVLFVASVGCSSGGGEGGETGPDGSTTIATDGGVPDGSILSNDPFPEYCGPDDDTWEPPALPTGTMECPSDKNLEGCPCNEANETAACWPGLRVNRNRGYCKDGTTTCVATSEFDLHWGPCEGAVLPTAGATVGPEACTCFSLGQWHIDNLSPCYRLTERGNPDAITGMSSTAMTDDPEKRCTAQGQPSTPFSTHQLTIDCAGSFKLCLTLKAGDFDNPQADDCVVTEVCTDDIWYGEPNVTIDLPPLPAWVSENVPCIKKFAEDGYAEMSVKGTSMLCEEIDDGGQPLVFHRLKYCPFVCMGDDPPEELCSNCGNGADGYF